MTNEELISKALIAKENSYSPYSRFKVGAAVLTKSGKVFMGANIENCAYWPSSCAERNAIYSAFSNGEKEIIKLAVVGGKDNISYPCGGCRQVFVELLPDVEIICAIDEHNYRVYKTNELLPHSFLPNSLK